MAEEVFSRCYCASQLQGAPSTPQPTCLLPLAVQSHSHIAALCNVLYDHTFAEKKPQTHISSAGASSQTSVTSQTDGETRTSAVLEL